MYDVLPSFVLGFHGCDAAVAEKVFSGDGTLKSSENDYDWLGPGIYFWENNPARALEYATMLSEHPRPKSPRINTPAVIGAVIDPGDCLNLLDSHSLAIVKDAYESYSTSLAIAGYHLPENRTGGSSTDLLLRFLDCAVIRFVHELRAAGGEIPFDTVRGVFVEGEPLYPGAGFHAKSHIQICVRDSSRIKGYFRVRE